MVAASGLGKITSGISPKEIIFETIGFVYSKLPAWRDDPSRLDADDEDHLNPQLCKFLNIKANCEEFPMVQFNHEEPQHGKKRSADLSASPIDAKLYSIYEPILVIECKRLPAPTKARQCEYVARMKKPWLGGIQRFKLGVYARGDKQAVIVGYIQTSTPHACHMNINACIATISTIKPSPDGCVWNTNESLKRLTVDQVQKKSRCKSRHQRIGGVPTYIEIHHLWICM